MMNLEKALQIINTLATIIGWLVLVVGSIYAGVVLVKKARHYLHKPRCPRFWCWSTKTISRFGPGGNPYYCAKCENRYWHKGWRNYKEDPDKNKTTKGVCRWRNEKDIVYERIKKTLIVLATLYIVCGILTMMQIISQRAGSIIADSLAVVTAILLVGGQISGIYLAWKKKKAEENRMELSKREQETIGRCAEENTPNCKFDQENLCHHCSVRTQYLPSIGWTQNEEDFWICPNCSRTNSIMKSLRRCKDLNTPLM